MSLFEQDVAIRRLALRTPSGLVAFGLGSGLSRYAPGTAGSLAAIPLALLLHALPDVAHGTLLLLMFLLGIHVCGTTSRQLGRHDPGGIVWDEIVGFCLTVAAIPPTPAWWLAAFALFRVFDILKPWPIRYIEQRVRGGIGIMLDDVLAAAYAMLVLAVLQRAF